MFYIGATLTAKKAFLNCSDPPLKRASRAYFTRKYELTLLVEFQVSDLSTIGRAQLGYAD